MVRSASPTPSHRQVSSMSPNMKAKKPGNNPRAKNSVRAKTGCYTCRIRRKKCDETNHHGGGSCNTCSRLRLQCLGWGTKRPDWLRGQDSVQTVRDKIKNFLASQGMIKGHAGSGPRVGDGTIPILRLDDGDSSSSTSSPPMRISHIPDASDSMLPNGHPAGMDAQRAQESNLRGDANGLQYPITMSTVSQPQFSTDSMPLESGPMRAPSDAMLGSTFSLTQHYPPQSTSSSNTNSAHSSPAGPTMNLPIVGHHSASSPPLSSLNHQQTHAHYTPHALLPPTHPHTMHLQQLQPHTHHSGSPTPSQGSSGQANSPPGLGGAGNTTVQSTTTTLEPQPAMFSTFGNSYNWNYGHWGNHGNMGEFNNPGGVVVEDEPLPSYENHCYSHPAPNSPSHYYPLHVYQPSMLAYGTDPQSSYSVRYYLQNVLPKQFILAGPKWLNHVMTFFLRPESPVITGIECLTTIHQQKSRGVPVYRSDVHRLYQEIRQRVAQQPWDVATASDTAMASLHFVSYVLFSGGRGPWEGFLNIARSFMDRWIRSQPYTPLIHMIQNAPNHIKFLLRTIMWFDVLACVSEGQQSNFLGEYNELFPSNSPHTQGRIVELGREEEVDEGSEISMLHAMGCHNSTVLAIARISALASWKTSTTQQGTFSFSELVRQQQQIEQLLNKEQDYFQAYSSSRDLKSRQRAYTAEIYRRSAFIYLYSVLSGDFPHSPDIKESVKKTTKVLKGLNDENPDVKANVARSVVFPLWITGCMASELEDRGLVSSLLELNGEERHGNCGEVAKLLRERVWPQAPHQLNTRQAGSGNSAGSAAVKWRELLMEGEVLLLV